MNCGRKSEFNWNRRKEDEARNQGTVQGDHSFMRRRFLAFEQSNDVVSSIGQVAQTTSFPQF